MDENLMIRRNEIKKRMIPLEWDSRLRQINHARGLELKAYRLELESIEKEIAGGTDAPVL